MILQLFQIAKIRTGFAELLVPMPIFFSSNNDNRDRGNMSQGGEDALGGLLLDTVTADFDAEPAMIKP